MVKEYRTPQAFRRALDDRLASGLGEGRDLARQRQLVVFDRLLARLVSEFQGAMILKGGLVLEMRLNKARTTSDVDVRFSGDDAQLLSRLQTACRLDLGDFMQFEVQLDPRSPKMTGKGIQYDGHRYRVQCKIGGKPYGKQSFGLDVGVGDPMITDPDVMTVSDMLGFAGVPPPSVLLYPIATHLAEKLHIYTYSEDGWVNSRDKDLPDIVLIAQGKALSGRELRAALRQTFEFRNTHKVPDVLPSPPSSWEGPYANMAEEFDLAWPTLKECYEAARCFIDPVLASSPIGSWSPETWAWSMEPD